jgi:hypothetical protein
MDEEVEFDFRMGDMDLDWLEFHDAEERDWDESKHPRDDHGRFGSGGGGSDDYDEMETTPIIEAAPEVASKYGFNAKEFEKIYNWVGGGYRELRTDPSFAKTLEKLPQANGKFFRGSRVTDAQLKNWKVGSVYKMDKFSSSSPLRDTAAAFMGSGMHAEEKKVGVFFEINGSGRKIPKDVAVLAGADDEVEVVLMRGNRYKIDSVEKSGPTDDVKFAHVRIKMSEVHA